MPLTLAGEVLANVKGKWGSSISSPNGCSLAIRKGFSRAIHFMGFVYFPATKQLPKFIYGFPPLLPEKRILRQQTPGITILAGQFLNIFILKNQ